LTSQTAKHRIFL